jgi:2-methylcitrate dehydratase
LGSIGEEPVEVVRRTVEELNPAGDAVAIWGADERVSPPDAAMMNTALIRYLDYMDAILLPGETPHPSDNVGAAIAAAEYNGRSGQELIAAVGLAYEVQGELAAAAPGRDIGWDHIHVTFGATAAAVKLFGLDHERIRNAIGIAAAANNPLRVTRTGKISMWKGIASSNMARNAVYTTMLVDNGMEGPVDAIDGQKGWKEVVQGRDFEVSFEPGKWIPRVMTKKYMAGTHAQTGIDALLALIDREDIDPTAIESIDVETYESAHHVMGGGEGDRHAPENREQADHSIPYTLAAAALDGQLMKEQYTMERITSDDVRRLMQTIEVAEDPVLTERSHEGEQPYRITVRTADGDEYTIEKAAYPGHPSNPMSWDAHEQKFHGIADGVLPDDRLDEIVETVKHLERHDTTELTSLLSGRSGA